MFEPGKSGNPAGRPKGVHQGKIAAGVREFMGEDDPDFEGMTRLQVAMVKLYERVKADGDVAAFREIANRGWGMPVETKELTVSTDATQTTLGKWLADMGGDIAPKP